MLSNCHARADFASSIRGSDTITFEALGRADFVGGRGAVSTVLVKRGTLKAGDPIIAGQEFGRVRALFDATGKQLTDAGPAVPVQVLGLSDAPNAGDDLLVLESERKVREVALYRQGKFRDVRLAGATKKVEDVFSQMGENAAQSIQLIVKADVMNQTVYVPIKEIIGLGVYRYRGWAS
jgi:translation initiation factor IF-2